MVLAPYGAQLAIAGLVKSVDFLKIEGVKFDGWDERGTPGAGCADGWINFGNAPTLQLGNTIASEVGLAYVAWKVTGSEPNGTVRVAATLTNWALTEEQMAELVRLCPDLTAKTIELGPLRQLPELDAAQEAALKYLGINTKMFGTWVRAEEYKVLHGLLANLS